MNNKFDLFEEVNIKSLKRKSYVVQYYYKAGFMWYQLANYDGLEFREDELLHVE